MTSTIDQQGQRTKGTVRFAPAKSIVGASASAPGALPRSRVGSVSGAGAAGVGGGEELDEDPAAEGDEDLAGDGGGGSGGGGGRGGIGGAEGRRGGERESATKDQDRAERTGWGRDVHGGRG